MLTPEYYENCTQQISKVYSDLEDAILTDVVRRILKTGIVTDSARWQIRKLQECGLLYNEILEEISNRMDKTENEMRVLFENAGVKCVENDNVTYEQAGLNPLVLHQSKAMLQILNAGYKKTLGNLKNLTLTTANTSQTAFVNACNNAYMMISSGAFSPQDAIRKQIKTFTDTGVKVLYPSGHTDSLDVAMRRAVTTGLGQTCREISETGAKEVGCDLMEITAHSGARPSHAEWQGRIVSLSGRRGYLTKDSIGYGTGAGFGGWNCSHDWNPFYESISERNYTDEELEELDAKNIEYNGKMYSEYELSQKQRAKEREIRSLKRDLIGINEQMSNPDTVSPEVQSEFSNTSQKLKAKEKALKDFTDEVGFMREKDREQVEGFNHSLASKSTWANKKLQSNLTSASNRGIIKVNKTTLTAQPNSITEVMNKKGGIDRNCYDSQGKQSKQLSNHNHGNPKRHPFGKNGEHAHDYIYDENGTLIDRPARELTDEEIKEIGDIL